MNHELDTSLDELKRLADHAGLGMDDDEIEALKPVYDLYSTYARQLHSIDLGAEEMVVEFHPDWPEV